MGSRVLQTTHAIPTPGWGEVERLARVAAFRADVQARGGVIRTERRSRNPVFDRRDERTSFSFVVDWPEGSRCLVG